MDAFNTVDAQWAAARFAGRDLRANKTFSTIDPAHNQFHVNDNTYVGERFLGHFGDGLDGWRLIGEAVSNYGQHALNEGQELIWGRADSDFLTSYHPSRGNEATGKALSPKFTATADQYLVFLIAGGRGEGVGLRLLANGAEVAVWRGRNTEQFELKFELIVHPLAYVAGKSLQLELFDNEHGDRGHIMLDHVMLVACDTCQMDERIILARALNAQPSDDDTVYLIPDLIPDSRDYFNVKYLYQGTTQVHIVRMDAPNLEQKVNYTLATMKNVSMVKVIEWNTVNRWIDDDIEPLAFLLAKYGRYLSSDEYDDFQVHNYVDISLERPWTFYEYMEPPTVQYDGGISLHGLALGQGKSSCQLSICSIWDRSVHSGAFCDGRPPQGWKSIMRYPCACTMLREKGSTRRMIFYGNRRTIRRRASGRRMRWSIRWSTLDSRLISRRAITNCAWSSITSRPRRRPSRWVFGSQR